MNIEKWINQNTNSLRGKTVVMSGSTGGLGRWLAFYLARLGANLVLLDRNPQKAAALKAEILKEHKTDVTLIQVDLEDEQSVFLACERLENMEIDFLLHNAGAYSIPRRICKSGYDNVFQINFLSPYYITTRLLPVLKRRNGKVVAVGSIAHNYSKSNPKDMDFSSVSAASRAYGNAKRYLMFSLYELFKNEENVSLAVTHPGITFTNITAHYPKFVFAIIKHPMKIIFPPPKRAALSVLVGFFGKTEINEWFGPRIFSIWGKPAKRILYTCSEAERKQIFESAQKALKDYENENR